MISVKLDLSSALGSARDQARRPTCLAFATSDAHAHAIKDSACHMLSPEYAFYFGSQRQLPASHVLGVQTDALFAAFANEGQPHESHFPYQKSATAADPLTPPSTPFPHVTYTRRTTYKRGSTPDIVDVLELQTLPILAVNITRSFQRASRIDACVAHVSGAMVVGMHALVAVGHGKHINGMTYVKVRNSWGNAWGDGGHAWLAADYLDAHLEWFATFTKI